MRDLAKIRFLLLGCTIAAVSAQQPVEHVKCPLQNTTMRGCPSVYSLVPRKPGDSAADILHRQVVQEVVDAAVVVVLEAMVYK